MKGKGTTEPERGADKLKNNLFFPKHFQLAKPTGLV